MARGAPAILQAYLAGPEAVGIADVLELAGPDPSSPTGHIYRVGEFKRATTLKTVHVFQVIWYDDLLTRAQGRSTDEGFVVLGDRTRRDLQLGDSRDAYATTRVQLLALRAGSGEPGPHLCTACPSCPWRSLCLPRLVAEAHLSLLPGISRARVADLARVGIHSWHDLAAHGDLPGLGIAGEEAEAWQSALAEISRGRPVLSSPLRRSAFSDLTVVALELAEAPGERWPRTVAVHFEAHGSIEALPVTWDTQGDPSVDLGSIPTGALLAFYGEADAARFLRLARSAGRPRTKYVDVEKIIKAYVHAPLGGLELEAVAAHAAGVPVGPSVTGRARVAAIRRVLAWLDGKEGTTAC